ncbi:LIC12192 family sporadic carbohydrate cluster protein [Thalassobaculum salexigens]|uniref:LIC12192 family sporadic carbohydrate cluster protein n=1 Tax=Thalassobaculum salexigens TaxID=455360 RepID=UPI000422A4ED|nr:LIC12192 family sporadic carbohydrate cluster protein [Thalassobaculum salexigens]
MTRAKTGLLQGYVTHQSFKGLRIPANVQNLVMREYARNRDKTFRLSRGEYYFDGCFVQLYAMLRDLDQMDGIILCSLFMLPQNPKKRREIFDMLLAAGGEMHCVFETLVVEDEAGVAELEDLYRLNDALDLAPQQIDRESLPPLNGIDTFT